MASSRHRCSPDSTRACDLRESRLHAQFAVARLTLRALTSRAISGKGTTMNVLPALTGSLLGLVILYFLIRFAVFDALEHHARKERGRAYDLTPDDAEVS